VGTVVSVTRRVRAAASPDSGGAERERAPEWFGNLRTAEETGGDFRGLAEEYDYVPAGDAPTGEAVEAAAGRRRSRRAAAAR